MARALIVACGCRGRELGRRLADEGWEVRGTTRDAENAPDIQEARIEAAVADPDQPASVLDHIGDVTLVYWLLGSAAGAPKLLEAIHGPRLERILEKIVDTPVRGFVYEAAGGAQPRRLESGAAIVRAAGERWRIPVEVVEEDPADWEAWVEAMLAAAERIVGSRG